MAYDVSFMVLNVGQSETFKQTEYRWGENVWWMNRCMLCNRIRNKSIRGMVQVALVEDNQAWLH